MNSPILRKFGMNICRMRTERHRTQAEIAERADVCERQPQRIKAGEPDPGLLIVEKIRRALGCDWNELTDGIPELRIESEHPALRSVHARTEPDMECVLSSEEMTPRRHLLANPV